MLQELIDLSQYDEKLRDKIKELLSLAESNVIVAASELSLLHFPDIYDAFKRATMRGVKVKIYATEAPSRTVKALRSMGCEVRIGKKLLHDHFMVIDGESYVVVKGFGRNPPTIGLRRGLVRMADPQGAKVRVTKFLNLFHDKYPHKNKFLGLTTCVMIGVLLTAIPVFEVPGELIASILIIASIITSYILR